MFSNLFLGLVILAVVAICFNWCACVCCCLLFSSKKYGLAFFFYSIQGMPLKITQFQGPLLGSYEDLKSGPKHGATTFSSIVAVAFLVTIRYHELARSN